MYAEDDGVDYEDVVFSEDEGEEEGLKEAFEEEYDEDEEKLSSKRKHDDEDHLGPNKKKKVSLHKVRIPTVKELNELRETQNLFHSNLFRLQIDEMLKEMQIKKKYLNLFQDWFEKLKSFLLSVLKTEEHSLSDKQWLNSYRVKPPVVFSPKNEKGSFRFLHPDDVTIGGSFPLQASLGPTITVDVFVHMPPACFQKTDHLNFQYIRKRALYLTVIAEALEDSELVSETHFVQANGSPLKPVLEVLPSGKLGKRMRILLWPVTQPEALHLQRLRPKRSNIHTQWFFGKPMSCEVSEEREPPSAYYNSEIAKDVVWQQNQEMLQAYVNAQSLRDGLILLKVWLHQRKLDQGYGGFSGFVLAMYLVYLAQARKVNVMMSSYQIIKITWNALASSDWTKEGIALSTAAAGPPLSAFHEVFDVVFVDASGLCNICAGVSPEVYFQVRKECVQAIKFLDTAGMNSFQALFLTPMNLELNCDHIIRFVGSSKLEKALAKHASPELSLKYGGMPLPQLLHIMRGPLQKGFGQRVKMIVLPPVEAQRWPCTVKPPQLSTFPSSLVLGLILDHEHASKKLDRGPPANTPEAAEFIAFWGEKAQLRRFRDGGIHEAVLWEGPQVVCQQVVEFILKKYVGLDPDSFLFIGNEASQLARPEIKELPQGEAASRAVIVAFDALNKELRAVRGLPLIISSLQGISSVFHYCDVFPPLALKRWNKNIAAEQASNPSPCSLIPSQFKKRLPRYCPVIEAVMTLEYSGKWPHDLEAVRRLKAAFCIQMAALYSKQFNNPAHPSTEYFDIYKDGYVFRIWMGYMKEIGLLKRKVLSDGSTMYQNNAKSRVVEDRIELLPRLSSALHGIQQQFPGFGPTVCLVKRWLSAQLLGPPHMPKVVTELLVAYLYLHPEPFRPAVQCELGLLRFLSLVSTTNWNTTPILVNLNGEFTVKRIADLESQFNSSRTKLPPLFLATPYDKTLSRWTREAPSLQILVRLAVLAKEALKFLKTQLLESSQPDYLPVFRPSMAVYDAVIYLRQQCITRVHESIDPRPSEKDTPIHKYVKIPEEKIPIIDFDPVQKYLTELREGYSHCALFFHDLYGGENIGVLWKPSAFEERDFKVSSMKGDKLLKNTKVCLNMDAILEDFYVLGKGVVKSIEVKNRKRQQNEVNGTSVT